MANEVSVIETVLTANTSQHDAALAHSEQQLNNFGSNASTAGVDSWSSRISGKLQSVGSSLTGIGASMVAGITAPLAYAIKLGSDLGESMNKVQVVFGSSAASVVSFSQTAATSLGLSQQAALDAAGGFGNMFTQLGIGADKAAQMSTSIIGLAADFASFHNADISEVLNSQSAAFRGEYDSLQRFLPLINAATVEQEAMAMTGKKATKELTAQEKALAVNALMFKGAGAAVGDFARTSDSMANAMRIVKAQLENLAAELGTAFLPYVQQALTLVRGWMTSFTNLSPEIKKTIITIVGFGAALGPVILGIGLAATALGTLLSPVGLVVAAVAGLGVAFATNFGGIRDTVMRWVSEGKKYYEDHKADIDALGVKVKQIFEDYIKDLAKAAGDLISTLDRMKSSIDGFSSSNDGSWKLVVGAIKIAVATIKAFLDTMTTAVNIAVTFISSMWKNLEENLIAPIRNALAWIKENTGAFQQAFSAITSAARIGLQVKSPPLAAKWIMMIGDAAEDNAKRVSKSAKDYETGFNLISSAIGVTGDVARILLERFHEIAKELYGQKIAANQSSEAFELYGTLIQTATGENTKFAKTVQENINKIFAQEKALRSTIIPSMAELNNTMSETIAVTKEMGEAIRDAVGSLVTATLQEPGRILREQILQWASAGKAAKEWGKVMTEGVRKLKDEIKSNLGDGVGGALIELAKKFGWNLTKVNDWSSGMLDIIGVLPGKIGERLRGATNKFLDFVNSVDRVFKGLHKIFDSVPDGIGGMLNKVLGLFKSATSQAGGSGGGLFGAIGGFFSKLFGGGGGGTGAMGTGLSEGMAQNASGGWLKSLGGALGIAGIGASLLPSIIGLFKGKSQIQKDTEKAQLDQLKANVAQTYEDIKATMVTTMQEGAKLLESLAGFVEVPRKAIKRFINQLELVLTLFVDMSKGFKADGMAAAKQVTDNLGDSLGFLLGGTDLINAIREVATISDENINEFIATTLKIVTKWIEAANQIEMQSAKFTGKISDKLMSSFAFLQVVPDVIKGFAESVKVDDSIIDSVFATATKLISKMKAMSEEQRGLELNKAGSTAGIFSTIFEASKGMLDLFKQLGEYKALDDKILDIISDDLRKLLTWGDGLLSIAEAGIAKFDTVSSAVSRLASSISRATSGISNLTGSTAGGGITANIQTQNGAGLLARGGASSSSTTIVNNTTTVNQTVQGSVYAGRELVDEIRKVVKEETDKLRRELLLSSISG